MEIEKKYLVKNPPAHLTEFEHLHIEQAYIHTNPVIRIRKQNDEYILTIKNSAFVDNSLKGAVTEELETKLTEEQYTSLLPLVTSHIIKKTRYLIPYNDNKLELDIYYDRLEGLYTVEVEFKTVEELNSFIPPDWFGDDVTYDAQYKNSSLSKL